MIQRITWYTLESMIFGKIWQKSAHIIRSQNIGYQIFPFCLPTGHFRCILWIRKKVTLLRCIEKSREQDNNSAYLFLWSTQGFPTTINFNWALVSLGGRFKNTHKRTTTTKRKLLISQKLACLILDLWDSASVCTITQPSLSCQVPKSFLHVVSIALFWLPR